MFIKINVQFIESFLIHIHINLITQIFNTFLIVFYLIEKLLSNDKDYEKGENYVTNKILSFKTIIFIILSIILNCLSEYKFFNEIDNEMEEYILIIFF